MAGRKTVEDEVKEYLLKNAEDCTFYVALGKAFRRDLAEKHGLTEDSAQGILSTVACQLVDAFRALK